MTGTALVTVKLTGMKDFEDDLARRELNMVKAIDAGLGVIARRGADILRVSMLSAASPSSPGSPPGVVTGNLIKSVRAVHQQGSLQSATAFGSNGKGGKAPHWYLLEFGTTKMAARPSLRPAGLQAGQEGQQLLTAMIKRMDGRGG